MKFDYIFIILEKMWEKAYSFSLNRQLAQLLVSMISV